MIFIRSHHADGYRLGIGAEGFQGIQRVVTGVVVDVAIDVAILIIILVSIGIRAVAAAIDITFDTAVDTHGITAIHITRDIVATIDVIDVAGCHQHAGGIVCREKVALNRLCRNGRLVGVHISHTATAIDVVNLHVWRSQCQMNTRLAGHGTLVTAAINIPDLAAFQSPNRTDGHLGLVVATKQATNLVVTTARIREAGVDSHLNLETIVGQQFASIVGIRIIRILDGIDHFTRIVQTNDRRVGHASVVTTAVGIDDGTAKNFQIGLAQIRCSQRGLAGCHHFIRRFMLVLYRINSTGFIGCCSIIIVAITATEELADINFGIIG